jgi:hypothetical protein
MTATCEEVEISRALTDLIREARLRGFWLYRWGPNDDPALLALVKRWPDRQEVDVILLRQDESSTGYRTLYFDEESLFRPEVVCWQYHAEAEWVFRAIYTIPEPGQPGAPDQPEKPDAGCRTPDDLPEPLAIRPLRTR